MRRQGRCEGHTTSADNTYNGHTSEQTDSQLVSRTLAGDTGAYAELVNRHRDMVYAIVSRICVDRDDADDVVAEVFIQAYKSLSSFKQKSSLSTWLYRIAVNQSIRRAKQRKNRAAASLDDSDSYLMETLAAPNADGPEAQLDKKERRRAVREAVEQLPDKHRLVIVLHYFAGLSCEDTAQALGCSVGTVWSRLHYACSKLRDRLSWLYSAEM